MLKLKLFSTIKKHIIILLSVSNILILAENKISKIPEGVSIYQLDNGIQVLLIEKPSLPMVGINTVVKVGSAYENFATSGMSHMLEHLLFNGTANMTQKELYNATDKIGGYNNANTSEYYTNFMMVTPSENIVEGMKLQAAMLFQSTMPKDKFEKEKGIVLEEIAKSLGKSGEQMERNILSIIYHGHSLSLPTLGTYETIKNMSRDDVYKFYKNYYVPNNMIISVIGNFKTDEMLKNLKEIYGTAKPGIVKKVKSEELRSAFEPIPSLNNTDKVYHRFYGGDKTELQLFFDLPNTDNVEYFDVLDLALEDETDDIKSQLMKTYSNDIGGLKFSTRNFNIKNYLQAIVILNSEDNINGIKDSLISILSKTKFELSPEIIETERVKSRTEFLKNTEKPHMFGIYNADNLAQYGIESILVSYSGKGFLSAADEVKKLNIEKNPIVIVQHPNPKENQSTNTENQKPILFESYNGSATVIAKQNSGSDLLAIHYLIKNKAAYEEKYGKGAAKILHDAFGERMKEPDVQKESAKFGFTFTVNDNPFIPMDNIYLSPEFGYIRVEGLADDCEGAINFLNNQMLNFIPTKDEYDKAVEKSHMSTMMGHENSAQKLFTTKVNEELYENEKYNPKKTTLTYDNLLEFCKYYFQPSNMIISVVSKESPETINKYFADFSKPIEEGSIDNSAFIREFKSISAPINIELNGGGEQSYLYYGFEKIINQEDKPALDVLSLILSDKIVFDIREKQGMAYRMNAGIDIIKDKAMFNLNLGTRPENIDKLIPQLPEIFTEKYLGKITQDDIIKTVNMYLGRMMFRRLSSINQAYYLGHSEYFHNDIFYDQKSLDELKDVTLDDVNRVVKKYLNVENPVKIIVR